MRPLLVTLDMVASASSSSPHLEYNSAHERHNSSISSPTRPISQRNLLSAEHDHEVGPRFDADVYATRSGMKPQARIVGGSPAPPNRYPYAASLNTDSLSRGLIHECGATLVGADLLLTAAHCDGSTIDGLKINSAVLGRYGRTNTDKSTFEYFLFENVLVHPDFSRYPVPVNDLNIIKLYGKSSHATVRLNSNPNIPRVGDTVTAMGWGATNTIDWELSDMLQEVDLGYWSNERCGLANGFIGGSFQSYVGRIDNSMLCSFSKGRDACLGDSGGTLILRGSNAGSDVQVGVPSFGISCATNFPGVNARISSHYEW